MITNDRYNINPPGTDSLRYKICFPHSKTHRVYSGPESVAASENPTRIEIYSWWNTLIRSAFYVFVYGKHYFASRNQNFQYKGGKYFMTEDTEQQDSIDASEVSSWTR